MFFLDIGGFSEGAKIATEHDGIGGVIRQAIRPLVYNINELIYSMMMNLYQLFEYLCNARLLDSDVLSGIASRAGVTLGIVMLFRVMFNFIQLVLDPDKSNDKEIGSTAIIKKCLLVIIMLGVSSYFFDALLYVQRLVINEKIIYKLVLPEKQTIETANFGGVLAARTFGAFYTTNEALVASDSDIALQCIDLRNLLLMDIAETGDFSAGSECLLAYDQANIKLNPEDENSTTVDFEAFVMDYNWLLQTIVGIMLVYILVNYAIKVGVRVIQLTVLQIISPMAIVSYLSPKKDNMFSKWWKIYFATYIDAFIRMAIIYFIIYICSLILDTWENGASTFFESVGSPTDYYTRGVFAVTMILALLLFAKKAPDLIKELMPASASKLGLGLSNPKEFLKDITSSPLVAPMKLAASPIGLLAKKTIGGIDSTFAGQGFGKGWNNVHGKFGTWLGKQREQYMPYSTDRMKQRAEGNKEVTDINNKWNKGSEIAKKLMEVTKRNTHGADDGKFSDTNPNAWNKVLNGDSANEGYYKAIFKNDNFVRSKMNVDKESNVEDALRGGYQQIQAGGDFTWNGTTYGAAHGNVDAFTKIYESQQKRVEGMKTVHESMRKQYQGDAQVEDQYKFIKGNDVNPAAPINTHVSRGIR